MYNLKKVLRRSFFATIDFFKSKEIQNKVIRSVIRKGTKTIKQSIQHPPINGQPASGSIIVRQIQKHNLKKELKESRAPGMTYNKATMPPGWRGYKIIDHIIVYHEADRAGPHIEEYLVIDNIAYNIGVQRWAGPELKTRDGKLTKGSKELVIAKIKSNYNIGTYKAQSTDHTPDEARTQWTNHNINKGYGSGQLREVVYDEKVQLYKTDNSIEFRAHKIDPDNNLFVFKLPTKDNPIIKCGTKIVQAPKFEDRLHLKTKHQGEEDLPKFISDMKNGVITRKEDGASVYFVTTPEGTNFFSPRISKVTGKRINYNDKVDDLVHIKGETNWIGMAELVYVDKSGNKLKSHEIGGILNKHDIPKDVIPIIYIYRMDKCNELTLTDTPYWTNFDYINLYVKNASNPKIQSVEIIKDIDKEKLLKIATQHEGLVGTPALTPIGEGYKFKLRDNVHDWKITNIMLSPGPKGRIAGTVEFENDMGEKYNIGASSLGNDMEVIDMMHHPDQYIGRYAKISSYKGHEGRAAKFEGLHLDK